MPELTILHFNDVYNIEAGKVEPVGGAARQVTVINRLAHLNPLVLFSGDALNPSTLSTVTRGKHMVPILNAMNVQCAVYGNHDFDFGIDCLMEVSEETDFPWLMSNVMDVETGEPLANGLISHTITWSGVKIGLMGIVEEEWIATLAAIDKDEVVFHDYIQVATRLAKQLREDEHCDVIIALTHMRWPNDLRLAEHVPDIDLLLGGHDHDYTTQQVNGRWVVKSGTDFQNLSQITLVLNSQNTLQHINVHRIDVDSSVEEEPNIKQLVHEYSAELSHKMEVVLAMFDVELEGRFAKIRTQETNLGNFICDIMLAATDADLAILNSGTLRSDRVHPRGEFSMKDLTSILPMLDPCVVLEITGSQILQALENGVCQYPALEGRFPQVAGVSFGFNPLQPPGKRVEPRHVHIGGETLDKSRKYRLVTKSYLMAGKDGYDCLKDCPVLVDDEDGPLLTTIVQNHFESLKAVQGLEDARLRGRRSSISLARRHSTVSQPNLMALHDMAAKSLAIKPALSRQDRVRDGGTPSPDVDSHHCHLCPENDGRIYIVTKERPDDLAAQTAQIASLVSQTRITEARESEEQE